MIKLAEGQKIIAENGDIYEIEDGDYVVINSKIQQGPILNSDILRSIDSDDKLELILDRIEKYGEHFIINQLITGMNIELEHTDDVYVALNIAADHVLEIHDYYTRLINMEAGAEKNLSESSYDKQIENILIDQGFDKKSISIVQNIMITSSDLSDIEERLYAAMKKRQIPILGDETLDLLISYADRM